MSEVITPDWLKRFRSDLIIRRYQIKAIDTLCALFENKRLRKFLLEMAPAPGKPSFEDTSTSAPTKDRLY